MTFETFAKRICAAHFFFILSLSFAFRIYVALMHMADLKAVTMGFLIGTAFDVAVAVYSFVPLILLIVFIPQKIFESFGPRKLVIGLLFLDLSALLFNLVAEFTFHDEFKDRFNFIAVDYLVYTNEVLQNIFQSYPLGKMIAALALASFFFAALTFRLSFSHPLKLDFSISGKVKCLAIYALAFITCFLTVTESKLLSTGNFVEEVVGKNGLHALFAAYRNNEINFDRFYTTTSSAEAAEYVTKVLKTAHLEHLNPKERSIVIRDIVEPAPFKKLNVVLVIMESLSAKFMKYFGNPHDLTPTLDRLAREGLFFDRIFATGTRTVRGIEAIVLSIPPTPGQSIVRRPAGIGLFNIGSPFRDQGYSTNFIYGGRALFDNMGAFFEGNGFQVFDQTQFPSAEIVFTNAWGVSDEDLFSQVIKISDSDFKNKKPFFHVVLNTSNHRPYTYPENRVRIKSGTGRDGAVQYSDFAVGKFLEDSKLKPWFADTVFIFVGDHNASVAGQSRVDPNDYRVPMLMYSPKWIKPGIVNYMGSQIDLAPTLFEFLSASYHSRFFGVELQNDDPARAFVSTYQTVGLLQESSLTLLSPNRRVDEVLWDGTKLGSGTTSIVPVILETSPNSLRATVSFYKVASDWFSKQLLQENKALDKEIDAHD